MLSVSCAATPHGLGATILVDTPSGPVAWLLFGVKAGPVPAKDELQNFLEIITERLKRLYDISS